MARSCNHCCSVKLDIAYNAHVSVALVVQHAMWMHHIVICGLLRSTSFFIERITCICWGGGNIELKMCVDFLYKFCVKHFSLNEVLRERWSKKYVVLHVKYLLLWYFNKIEFSNSFSKNPQKWNFVKILQVRAESFHANRQIDWWTDMLRLIVAF